jgi:hypothetical protein
MATLAAQFSFDGTSPLVDLGPNFVSSNGSNYAFISGVTLQAISFTGSSSSFFQASGFVALGTPNQPFSFSLWVQPQALAGTLVQTSIDTSGASSCASFIGFASNGSLIAQVKTNTSYVAVSYPNIPLNSFTHIVQTWSSTNGLQLYINSNLVSSATATSYWTASNWVNYVTLGGCLSGCGNCSAFSGNQIASGSFTGAVDDFRVYSRELTADDVCTLFIYK